jgi:hypothetical protein
MLRRRATIRTTTTARGEEETSKDKTRQAGNIDIHHQIIHKIFLQYHYITLHYNLLGERLESRSCL